ncbi:hypothetical protein GCM10027277_04080 [Pseudoduganella ginsengisoli]
MRVGAVAHQRIGEHGVGCRLCLRHRGQPLLQYAAPEGAGCQQRRCKGNQPDPPKWKVQAVKHKSPYWCPYDDHFTAPPPIN